MLSTCSARPSTPSRASTGTSLPRVVVYKTLRSMTPKPRACSPRPHLLARMRLVLGHRVAPPSLPTGHASAVEGDAPRGFPRRARPLHPRICRAVRLLPGRLHPAPTGPPAPSRRARRAQHRSGFLQLHQDELELDRVRRAMAGEPRARRAMSATSSSTSDPKFDRATVLQLHVIRRSACDEVSASRGLARQDAEMSTGGASQSATGRPPPSPCHRAAVCARRAGARSAPGPSESVAVRSVAARADRGFRDAVSPARADPAGHPRPRRAGPAIPSLGCRSARGR